MFESVLKSCMHAMAISNYFEYKNNNKKHMVRCSTMF